MHDDYDEAGRCPTCDSRRHYVCTGFPGAVYAKHGQGWFSYMSALALEAQGHEVVWDDVWSFWRWGITPPEDRIVVVDTETTGLDPKVNEVCEVAWYDMGSPSLGYGESIAPQRFIPPHTLANFDPKALELNHYRERDLGNMETWAKDEHNLPEILGAVFDGAIIAGSNVAFDKSFLAEWDHTVANWRHTPLEIGSVAAGFIGRRLPLRGAELPEALGLHSTPDHTAAGDVMVVVEALRKMWSR